MTSLQAEQHRNKHISAAMNCRRDRTSVINCYKIICVCVLGLLMTCEAAIVVNPAITSQYLKDSVEIVEAEVTRSEQNEHEPPVTSSDLPKQIPAPPRPHFASTPHYEQQIARFVWVTPQYNTPYPIAKEV